MNRFESNIFGGGHLPVNERALEQDNDRQKGGYGDQYYDENEQRAGQEKYDLATGQEYKNDRDVESSHAFVNEKPVSQNEELINELVNDPATEWLLKNNFDAFGNKIEPSSDDNIKPAA